MVVLDVLICVIAFIIGLNFKESFTNLDTYDKKILDQLFYFHLFLGIVFYFYVQGRGDAVYYWMYPKEVKFAEIWYSITTRSYASDYVYLLNFFFANTLNLSFFTGSILYCVLGYIAIVYYYVILKKVVPNHQFLKKTKILNISIFPFFLFFPNLHFWSSGVGKDTLLFACIALFIYSLLEIRKNFIKLILSLVLSIFIRPHITMFLIVSFGISTTVSRGMKQYQKLILVLGFIVGFTLMFDFVLDFIQLESIDYTSVETYANNKVKALSAKSTSGVDVSSYPYLLKILTFLYRPLFFDINNAIAIIASFENLFLLLLTRRLLKRRYFRLWIKSGNIVKGSTFFLLIGTLTFSLILGNLGIMLREKNMFTPLFLIVAYWLMSYPKIDNKMKKGSNGY